MREKVFLHTFLLKSQNLGCILHYFLHPIEGEVPNQGDLMLIYPVLVEGLSWDQCHFLLAHLNVAVLGFVVPWGYCSILTGI